MKLCISRLIVPRAKIQSLGVSHRGPGSIFGTNSNCHGGTYLRSASYIEWYVMADLFIKEPSPFPFVFLNKIHNCYTSWEEANTKWTGKARGETDCELKE